jgi:toxin FitB
MIVLDTNVLSALMRHSPDTGSTGSTSNLAHPFGQLPSRSLKFVTDCIFCRLGSDARLCFRHSRESLLRRSRIVSLLLIQPPAQQAGDLMAVRHKKGRPGELRDTMIAGIVLASHAKLATRNASHFEDLSVPVVNPWSS